MERLLYLCTQMPLLTSATLLSIVALLGLEYTHAEPKSYRGLLKKSSRKVALGVQQKT